MTNGLPSSTTPKPLQASPPIPETSKLLGAASRSYAVASIWEQSAPLTLQETALIDQLSLQCSTRPLPPHVSVEEQPVASVRESKDKSGDVDEGEDLEAAVLQTSQKFYGWHAKLEAVKAREAEEKYREYADTLAGHLETCAQISGVIDDSSRVLEDVLAGHKDAVGRSQSLHETGERLVEERQQLVEFAGAVRSRLFHFEELEKIAGEFHTLAALQNADAILEDGEDPFLPLLTRVDACIAYVLAHPQYSESSLYLGQFRRLQAQALSGIRHKVNLFLKESTKKLMDGAQPGPDAGNEEGSEESSLMHIRFRSILEPVLKPLVTEVEARSEQSEYAKLLQDCQRSFCQCRLSLMTNTVRNKVAALQAENLDALVRDGFYFLFQICRGEHQIFCRFFPGSSQDLSLMTDCLMDPLGIILYDHLRPILIQLQEVGKLCEVVEILQNEVIQEQMHRWGEVLEPLQPVVTRTLADTQERLTYRMQAFVKEGIYNYTPAEEDINYPQCLQAPEVDVSANPAQDEADGEAAAQTENGSKKDAEAAKWYPPLQMVLIYLSRLYHCLDAKIFGGLAHEAVLACGASIVKAGRMIGEKSGRMDGQLFTIRHLLLLREEIAIYKAEFSVVEKDLDFSHMRDHLRRILNGEASLFALSNNNAVVQLVSRAGPRVLNSQIDSKKRLEKQLKEVCEDLIMSVTKTTVEPMLSFITKVTIRGSNRDSSGQSAQRPLRELAFASVERISEMVVAVNESLKTKLPDAIAKLRLYLPKESTCAIIFRPIKSNISEAHSQVASIFAREYEKEEIAGIPLLAPKDLTELLDSMS